jgi:serine/threonine protein kinase
MTQAALWCSPTQTKLPSPPSGHTQVKICDFGLAKYSSSCVTNRSTTAAASARTLEYSSPERLLRGRRSKPDDVYAFGILMYFIATSLSPYSDIGSEDVERVVRNGVRPDIEEWEEGGEYSPEVMQGVVGPYCKLARQCWHEVAAQRPGFDVIYTKLDALVAVS